MTEKAGLWAATAAAFSDGRTFTTAEAAEVLRPHINPMVALRKVQTRRRTEGRVTSWETYETRRLDDVTVGLRCIASELVSNRTGKNGCSPLVVRVGPGQYRLLKGDA